MNVGFVQSCGVCLFDVERGTDLASAWAEGAKIGRYGERGGRGDGHALKTGVGSGCG